LLREEEEEKEEEEEDNNSVCIQSLESVMLYNSVKASVLLRGIAGSLLPTHVMTTSTTLFYEHWLFLLCHSSGTGE